MSNKFFKFYSENKNIYFCALKICGINSHNLKRIYLNMGWPLNNKQSNLKKDTLLVVFKILDYYFNLFKNKIFNGVELKRRSKSYAGMRHILRLPVRGQRTHTNSRTSRRNTKLEI